METMIDINNPITRHELELILEDARQSPQRFNALWAWWEAAPVTHPWREAILVALFTLHAVRQLR